MPPRTLANIPAALVPLQPPPGDLPSLGVWKRLLGNLGATTRLIYRADSGGFTLIGERLLSAFDLSDLDARMEQADEKHDGMFPERHPWPDDLPPLAFRMRSYECVEESTGKAIEPRVDMESGGPEFSPSGLDGDRLQWRCVRLRWEKNQ